MRWHLQDGAEIELWPDFLSVAEQPGLFSLLRQAVPWQRRELHMFGRSVLEPRATAWIGDAGAVYTYSGRVNRPEPWIPALSELRARVSQRAEARLNCVLCNLYESGDDSMGLHADDEPELGRNPVIASLSLGATRRFQLRHRKRRVDKHELELSGGSLLVMRGATQHHYRHGIPKQPKIREPRINLTFRFIAC